MIDRQASSIAHELRDDLGDWIQRRLQRGVGGQGDKARAVLDECGIPVQELREQWALQLQAQMSLRARKSSKIAICPLII